jgi:hypothetical protein
MGNSGCTNYVFPASFEEVALLPATPAEKSAGMMHGIDGVKQLEVGIQLSAHLHAEKCEGGARRSSG